MEFTPGNELRQCNTDLLRTKSKKKKNKMRTEHTSFSKVILLPKMSFYSTMLIDERVRFKWTRPREWTKQSLATIEKFTTI